MLRAYDKATGREVGAVYMPAPQSGSPMTYMLNGEQYLVVAVSGAQYAGELLAFKLPRRLGLFTRRVGCRNDGSRRLTLGSVLRPRELPRWHRIR